MGSLVMILGFWGYSIAPETSRALKGTQTLPEKLVIATPGNSVGDPFWDGENVTLSKAVCDLQLGIKKGHFESHGIDVFVDICCLAIIYSIYILAGG